MTCLHPIFRRHALRLAIAVFVIAPSVPVLAADCAQWNVAGMHSLVQSNTGFAQMTLRQDGTQFKGQIQIGNKHRPDEADSYYDYTFGDIVGTAVGSKFEATVYWNDSKVGVYSGQIGPQGLVVGRTFNKNNPSESADFHGSPAFDCLPPPAPNGAGNANNGNSGKPPVALGRTNAPAPPPLKVSPLPGSSGQPLAALNPQLLAPKTSAAANVPTPSIAEPRDGGTYPPQTPLAVRIVPAKDAKDTAYRMEIEVQQNILVWHNVATLSVPAVVAQSPQGYRDWGANQDASKSWMGAATPGTWRVRVSTSAPQAGLPGNWVVFKIAGQPGNQLEGGAGQSANAGGAGQPQPKPLPLPSKTPPAASNATPLGGARNNVPAALLNPQGLPPKTLSAASSATSLDAARNKAGPVLLNPQPLPPSGLQQVPSGLQQAPGAFR
jgi:hypothetical protein